MKYFKRLRNWLTTFYSGWAIPQQLGIHESTSAERAVEETPKHRPAEQLVPEAAALHTSDQDRSSETSASPKTVEGNLQSPAATTTATTTFREPTITDAVWVKPVAEPRQTISQERDDSTGARQQHSDQLLSPVSSSADQSRPVTSGEEQAPQAAKQDESAKLEDAPAIDHKDSQRVERMQEAKPTVKEIPVRPQPAAKQPPETTQVQTQAPKELRPQISSQVKEPVADNGSRTPPPQPKTTITVTTNVPSLPDKVVVEKPSSSPVAKGQPSGSVNPQSRQPSVTAPVSPSTKPKKAGTSSTREVTPAATNVRPGQPIAPVKNEPRVPQKPVPASKTSGRELDATNQTQSTAIVTKKPATRPKQSPLETVTANRPPASNSQAPQTQPVVSKIQAPQAQPAASTVPTPASTDLKPQGENGAAAGILSRRGKYDPGVINDQTALRLARLLVSEIKLYNMNKIEAAGAVNNIYDLLKDPIDKSRKHYQQRLGKTAIENMPDYFHSELVRALCEGDASRLGPNYQAPEE